VTPVERPIDRAALGWALASIRAANSRRVLDVGCGDGRMTAELARAAPQVVGVDPSPAALERAHASHPQLELAQMEPSGRLPFEDAAFDAAVCMHVLEHVVDTQALMSEIRRVLRSRGLLVLAVPYWGRAKNVVVALLSFERHHDPLEPTLRFYTPRSLRHLLDAFGFEGPELSAAGGLPLLRETLLARARRG
jgi:ubiquinone/menaquinone biosynthesis C-methylase UbiE